MKKRPPPSPHKLNSKANREALKKAIKAGWRYERIKSGYRVFPPDGSRPITIHSSDKGGRVGEAHAIRQLRQHGLS